MFPRISNMKPFLKGKKNTHDTYKVFVFFMLYSLSSLKEKKRKMCLKKISCPTFVSCSKVLVYLTKIATW